MFIHITQNKIKPFNIMKNKYVEQFEKLTNEQQKSLLMFAEPQILEFTKLKTVTDQIECRMLRVVHDGKEKSYNNKHQFQQNLTDLTPEFFGVHGIKLVEVTGIECNFESIEKRLHIMNFSGIKEYHLFLKNTFSNPQQLMQITRKI